MGIQKLCKKYKITTIALSQLSRPQNGSTKPTMHSLRSSGQLEQDEDIGFLLYRPEPLEEGIPDEKRVFDAVKLKDSKIMKVKMHFEGKYQMFSVVDCDR